MGSESCGLDVKEGSWGLNEIWSGFNIDWRSVGRRWEEH